jgi:hypothetical protein
LPGQYENPQEKFSVGPALSGACDNLANHSSELIHQIYQRERVDDMAQWRDAVKFPA